MKKVSIVFFFFLITVNVKSQNGNYKITYRHCLQPDTSRVLLDTIGIEAILIGNSTASNYRFAKFTEAIQKQTASNDTARKVTTVEAILANKQGGQASIKIGIPFDTIGNMVFWDKKSDSLSVREKMIKEYVITTEKRSEITWNITENVRMIKNYTCLKATAEFRGRKYTAWFTPDLPIAEGPWKFKGLPGLIMDIYDEDYQIKIYVTDVVYPSAEPVQSFVPKGMKITLSEYVGFLNEEQNRQTRNLESMFSNQQGIQNTNQQVMNPKLKNRRNYYKIEKRL